MGTITADVREALGESRTSLARHNVPIEEATTPSLDALKAYTEGTAAAGRRARDRSDPVLRARHRRSIRASRSPTRRCRASTAASARRAAARSWRGWRTRTASHVSERERLFITYQYHDRFTGDQTEDPRDAGGLEAHLSARLPAGERAGGAAEPSRRLPGGDAEAEEAIRRNPAHAFPHSNLAYALRGAGRFAEARRWPTQAIAPQPRDGAAAPAACISSSELHGDPQTARAQMDWATTSRVGFDIIGARAQMRRFTAG